jgi:hypothetical protein
LLCWVDHFCVAPGHLTAFGLKGARGRQMDKAVTLKAMCMRKEEAPITEAKVKEKERGRRSWVADT